MKYRIEIYEALRPTGRMAVVSPAQYEELQKGRNVHTSESVTPPYKPWIALPDPTQSTTTIVQKEWRPVFADAKDYTLPIGRTRVLMGVEEVKA